MSDTPKQNDWSKPAAMAIPKEGYFKVEQGRYGPLFPTYACVPWLLDHREAHAWAASKLFASMARTSRHAVADEPHCLEVLKFHYLRWMLFDIKGETYFMYQGIFDTDFDKYTEDAVALFSKTGIITVFENLEGFPEDWETNAPAFIKFVREHQRPSFLEYGEYPYVSAEEIKKALKLKAAFSDMLDLMQ